jgi:hypothetical protein
MSTDFFDPLTSVRLLRWRSISDVRMVIFGNLRREKPLGSFSVTAFEAVESSCAENRSEALCVAKTNENLLGFLSQSESKAEPVPSEQRKQYNQTECDSTSEAVAVLDARSLGRRAQKATVAAGAHFCLIATCQSK